MKRTFYAIVFLLVSVWTVAEVRYHVTDLSELAADSEIVPSTVYCINNHGDIAGSGTPTADDSTFKPFLYDAATETFINLGNLSGNFVDGDGGNGYGINNAGQVVGRNGLASSYRPFLFTDGNHNTVVDPNEMVNLTIDSQYSYGWAEAVNDAGQVVGFNRDTDKDYYGWVWTDLNENGFPETGEKQFFGEDYYPNDINNHAEIVINYGTNGYLCIDDDGDGYYDSDEQRWMPLPDAYYDSKNQIDVPIIEITPLVINDDGAVCGAAENPYGTGGVANGFFWQDSNQNTLVEADEYTVFGSLMLQTHVRAMNNHSQIVGGTYEYDSDFPYYSESLKRSAFMWTPSEGMQNLNALTDSFSSEGVPGWLSQAEGINDKGQIVASGWFDYNESGVRGSSEIHAFVLTPYLEGDISGDDRVDLADVSILSQYFQQPAEVCPQADLDGSGTIDFSDFILLSEDWMLDLNTL